MTQEFIIHQLENYQKLIDSGIIEESVKEEQGPVKKLVQRANQYGGKDNISVVLVEI